MIRPMAQRKAGSDGQTKVGENNLIGTVRTRVDRVVWLVSCLCALLLAVGALLVSLDANQGNALVELVVRGADAVDLGVFSRDNGVFDFRGDGAEVKNALVNWGLGAIAYLVVGRILDRVVRP